MSTRCYSRQPAHGRPPSPRKIDTPRRNALVRSTSKGVRRSMPNLTELQVIANQMSEVITQLGRISNALEKIAYGERDRATDRQRMWQPAQEVQTALKDLGERLSYGLSVIVEAVRDRR